MEIGKNRSMQMRYLISNFKYQTVNVYSCSQRLSYCPSHIQAYQLDQFLIGKLREVDFAFTA